MTELKPWDLDTPPAEGDPNAPPQTLTWDQWCELVRHHDLTYSYSDDPGVYRRGRAVHDLILGESIHFSPRDVARVWNELVDSFLIPEARSQFYWHHHIEE